MAGSWNSARRRIITGVLLASTLVAACDADQAPSRAPTIVARTHQTMGSDVRVSVWTSNEAAAYTAMTTVFAEFDRLDALLSVWKPGSDVLRLNAAAGRAPVAVSSETREVLQQAQRVSEWTNGKFDVTFGALADVWKFDHDRDNRVPAGAEIAARLPLIDYTAINIDEAAGTAYISRPGMRIHLGGIGKGYAVDRAAALLRREGFPNFMIQAGGDLYVAGLVEGGPWRLGVHDPRGRASEGAPNDSFATIDLSDATLSTSGDYERFFIKDGQRYHHLLDPDTGQPARGCVSVTIVAKTATIADALSTGVFILGPEKGMALVERLPDVEAVIVTADNQVSISSGLQGRVQLRDAPTPTRP